MVIKGNYNSFMTIHPGETVQEYLEFVEMSQSELSARTGLSRKTINQILKGLKPITPKTALAFERVLGISKEGLLNMQALFDVEMLKTGDQENIKEEIKLMRTFKCYSQLANYGFVKKTLKPKERVEELLRFFSVSSLNLVQDVIPVQFRKLDTKNVDQTAVFSWLRIGHIEAEKCDVPEYDRKKLINRLNDIRNLPIKEPRKYPEKLVEILAECGVILVYAPYISRTYINGATRWISSNNPVIQVCPRGAQADTLWFTVFHEIGHILRHKKELFVNWVEYGCDVDIEKEADLFAQKQLFRNEKKYQKLKDNLSEENMHILIPRFAKEEGLDQGIVAGRLARETGQWKKFAPYRHQLKLIKKDE